MPEVSAGLLLFRRHPKLQIFLVHPGGPYWARKDEGAWSIPKGLVTSGENALLAARREFLEETGFAIEGDFHELGSFRLPSGKILTVWTIEGDCDPASLSSNAFDIEWPPHSGTRRSFPEVDRGAWFEPELAMAKITKGQRAPLERFFVENC